MPTNTCRATRFLAFALAGFAFAFTTTPALAQSGKSIAAAKELTDTMDRLKLDSIAAADPTQKDTFVAALYFPGAQLLVVSAQYTAPSLLVSRLEKKEYRDTYIDLNAASVPASKIFVMDAASNGLSGRPEDSQAPDTWEHANKTVVFDGDWKKAKLSEEEYLKVFSTADEQYARMLSLLTEQARKSGS